MLSGIIDLKVVLTDGDGDTATDTIDLGSLIKFEDDGPAIDIVATGATLVLDELLGITGSVQNEGGAANNDETNRRPRRRAPSALRRWRGRPCLRRWCRTPGADGQASKVFTLVVNSAASGLDGCGDERGDHADVGRHRDADPRVLVRDGLGRCFTITVAADGSVTVNQFRAVEHNDSARP